MHQDMHDFVTMSQAVGRDFCYIQGAGGNTSVKLDKDRMAIKASGYFVKDITPTDAYSIVSIPRVLEFLNDPTMEGDDAFAQAMLQCVVETDKRPSIETSLHALLDKYVIHTHSVFVNILTCSEQGQDIAQDLFPNALWLDYYTPGLDLSLVLQEKITQSPAHDVSVIFLGNHGILVSADNASDATAMHENVNHKIKQHFNIDHGEQNVACDILPLDFIHQNIIFPDQVVFSMAGVDMLKTTAARETLQAYSYVVQMIEQLGLSIKHLAPHFCEILLNMEGEKYRQNLNTKK